MPHHTVIFFYFILFLLWSPTAWKLSSESDKKEKKVINPQSRVGKSTGLIFNPLYSGAYTLCSRRAIQSFVRSMSSALVLFNTKTLRSKNRFIPKAGCTAFDKNLRTRLYPGQRYIHLVNCSFIKQLWFFVCFFVFLIVIRVPFRSIEYKNRYADHVVVFNCHNNYESFRGVRVSVLRTQVFWTNFTITQ